MTTRIHQEILALKQEFGARIDALLKVAEAEASDNPLPTLMTTAKYAKHCDMSQTTIKRWIKAGLPIFKRGHAIRVKVAEADAWRESETQRIRASAEHDAHRGQR